MAQGVADRDAGEARAAQRALDARGRAPAADVIGGGVAEILRGAPGDLLDPEVPAAALDHRLIVAEEARTGARCLRHRFEQSAGMIGPERSEERRVGKECGSTGRSRRSPYT